MNRSDKEETLQFLLQYWPPANPLALYNMGWQQFRELGKIPSIRAVLAVYACRIGCQNESEYERTAIQAVEEWVVNPTDEKRKILGQIAGMQEPGYSYARNLANMASRSVAWQSAVAYNLTGNPNFLADDDFVDFCSAIYTELRCWAADEGDPVAERLSFRIVT